MKRLLLLVAVTILGCTTLEDIRNRNREHLNRLAIGMSKPAVLSAMGSETVAIREYGHSTRFVSNPYRSETASTADGSVIEILYYYTDLKASDNAITDDELTPIVLKEGKVIGWGRTFFDQNVHKAEIRVR